MSEPTRDDLERAVATVVNDCLGVMAGEEVLVVANPATLGLGERLRGEAGRAGADAVLALMASPMEGMVPSGSASMCPARPARTSPQ